jgi:hypothetical protein
MLNYYYALLYILYIIDLHLQFKSIMSLKT